jgi:hypothetical protein
LLLLSGSASLLNSELFANLQVRAGRTRPPNTAGRARACNAARRAAAEEASA